MSRRRFKISSSCIITTLVWGCLLSHQHQNGIVLKRASSPAVQSLFTLATVHTAAYIQQSSGGVQGHQSQRSPVSPVVLTKIPLTPRSIRLVRTGKKWRVWGKAVAQKPVGHSGNWARWAWEHPNTLLQQSQGKGEAKSNPGGGAGWRRGDSPQQDGGHGQAGGLMIFQLTCWQNYGDWSHLLGSGELTCLSTLPEDRVVGTYT